MMQKSTRLWIIFLTIIIIVILSIIQTSYLNLTSYYKIPNWRVNVILLYDASISALGSVMRRIDLTNDQPSNTISEIHLDVELSSLKKMVSNLPSSAKKKYYKARLLYPDGKWRNVNYRLRGRNIWHWSEEKPSIRIKTKKNNPLSLHRHLNLINPEGELMIANPFGEYLSRKFGVLAPNTEMVKLYINKKFHGVYQFTNREDESFLRFNKKFPGPLFVGKKLKKQWNINDFDLSGDLDVLEFSNPMKKVTELLSKGPSKDNFKNFWNLVDIEKLSSWAALMTVTSGKSADFVHNQLFYFDPTLGKIEPVVSDSQALGTELYPRGKERILKAWQPSHDLPIHERLTPMTAYVMADPRFVYLKNKKIYESIQSFASVEKQIKLLDEMYLDIESAVFSDPFKSALQGTFIGTYRIPYSNSEFINEKQRSSQFIKLRTSFILKQLQKSNIALYEINRKNNDVEFIIETSGHSAVNFNSSEILKKFNLKVKNSKNIMIDVNSNLLLYPELLRNIPKKMHSGVNSRRSHDYTLKPGVKFYSFSTSKSGWKFIQKNYKGLFKNAITNQSVNFVKKSSYQIKDKPHTLWILSKQKEKKMEFILGPGKVVLEKNLFTDENTNLIIEPGTNIFLGPSKSIIAKGEVHAKGTKKKPITINRLKSNKPWGVFAVVGKKSSGTTIYNLVAKGGSKDFQHNINFSGMVSFHHINNLKIKNLELSDNLLGDDTLRIVSSNVFAENLNIYSCAFDCIDFDFVSGKVNNAIIEDAGNDCFDFMSSNINLNNIRSNICGDKGFSIGELSNIYGSNVNIANAEIAIAVKDKSLGTFKNIKVSDSNFGISNYKKNWRYGGSGKVVFYNAVFNNITQKDSFSNNINFTSPSNIKQDNNSFGKYPIYLWSK